MSYDEMTTIDWLSMTSSNSSTSPPSGRSSTKQFEYVVWVYISPIVFFVGLVGNILSIIVLRRKAFRHTTTGIYIPMIACSDCVVLLTGLLTEWLEVTGLYFVKEHDVWSCRFHKFFFYTSGDVSIWLIVAFTFDRFVAVCFPLSKRRVCAPRRAMAVSASVIALAVAKNLHEFWTRGTQYYIGTSKFYRTCGYPQDFYYFHSYVRPWIAFTIVTALPFTLILTFNCLIVRSLIIAQRMRARTAAAASGGSGTASSFKQTTLMCLSVSFAFLICIAPSIVMLIGKPYWAPARSRPIAYRQAKAVNNLLVYVNHSINFVLYCVTGKRFRDELAALFAPMSRQLHSTSEPVSSALTQTGQTGHGRGALVNRGQPGGEKTANEVNCSPVGQMSAKVDDKDSTANNKS